MKILFYWEHLTSEPPTYRAKVFGGWVLRTYDVNDSNSELTSEAMVFIPDQKHEWKIN